MQLFLNQHSVGLPGALLTFSRSEDTVMVLSPVSLPDAPVETILARLKGVRKSLHGWVACCQAHSDREPSLSIGLGDEGQVLLTCFAGCSLDSIVEAIIIPLPPLSTHFPYATHFRSRRRADLQ